MCIEKRSEILFCYDVTDANPNGDPLDENKPRIDEETKINIVTDVRLKRTVRDYLYEYKGYNGQNGKDIFVREIIYDKEGHIQDAKLRARDFIKLIGEESEEEKLVIKQFLEKGKVNKSKIEIIKKSIGRNLLNDTIDVRLFGATIPLEFTKKEIVENVNQPIKTSVTFTGPVQFKMGRSLHKVELKHIKGTGAFASKQTATQATFRDEYILPYSFICFHGIINETAAKYTKLTDEDVKEMLDAMWNGTKNLISRSKFGQMPRLLLKVTYREPGFFIGDLDKKIKLTGYENDFSIRSVKDFNLNLKDLKDAFDSNKDKIEKIEYKIDENLSIVDGIPNNWINLEI